MDKSFKVQFKALRIKISYIILSAYIVLTLYIVFDILFFRKEYKGFKVKIYPNKEQQEKLFQFFGAARFAYNWTIAKEEDNYK